MGKDGNTCATLRAEIAATEAQLARLKLDLVSAEEQAGANSESTNPAANRDKGQNGSESRWPLLPEEYGRYGRQMIVSQVGLPGKSTCPLTKPRKKHIATNVGGASVGQLKLRSAKVLLVGAGGLGCPAAQYLAGAGVGTLGLIDGDTVEISNLHRQVLHRSRNVGKYKVDSAIEALRE